MSSGRDSLIITEALATAILALEQLPDDRQPANALNEMRRLLSETDSFGVSLHLAQAKCRLFPDLDREAVYQFYGLSD